MPKGQIFMIRPNAYPTPEYQKNFKDNEQGKTDLNEMKNYKFEQVHI